MNRKKILIIDDEADFCLLLKSFFLNKYEVYHSYTLNNGMKLLEEINPDILFLDNNLPDGSGWNKADQIIKTHPDLQLTLMSTYGYDVPQLNKSSFRILEKPLKLNELSTYL